MGTAIWYGLLGLLLGIGACSSSHFGSISGPLGFSVAFAGVSYPARGGTPTFQHVEVTVAEEDLSFKCDPGWDGGLPVASFSIARFTLLSHNTDPGPRKYTFDLTSVTKANGPAELTMLTRFQGTNVGVVARAISGEVDCTQLDGTGVSCQFDAVVVEARDGGMSTLSGSFHPELCRYLPDYP